jgi:hypothetical protein
LESVRTVFENLIRQVKAEIDPVAVRVATDDIFGAVRGFPSGAADFKTLAREGSGFSLGRTRCWVWRYKEGWTRYSGLGRLEKPGKGRSFRGHLSG